MIRTCTRLTARTHRTEERIKPDGDKNDIQAEAEEVLQEITGLRNKLGTGNVIWTLALFAPNILTFLLNIANIGQTRT
jgi:hypothetical protein